MNQFPKQEPQGNLLYKQISTTYHTRNFHYVFHIGYLMILLDTGYLKGLYVRICMFSLPISEHLVTKQKTRASPNSL